MSNNKPGNVYSISKEERKQLKREQKNEKRAWNDLIRRAKVRGALIEENTQV